MFILTCTIHSRAKTVFGQTCNSLVPARQIQDKSTLSLGIIPSTAPTPSNHHILAHFLKDCHDNTRRRPVAFHSKPFITTTSFSPTDQITLHSTLEHGLIEMFATSIPEHTPELKHGNLHRFMLVPLSFLRTSLETGSQAIPVEIKGNRLLHSN